MTITLECVASMSLTDSSHIDPSSDQRAFTVNQEHGETGLTTLERSEVRCGLLSKAGFVAPSTHKAVLTPKVGETLNLTVVNVPFRRPETHEAVVRMHYSGICRSDASFSVGPLPGYPAENHVPGHEGIGQIVEAYDHALLGRFVGLRYLGSTCGSCPYCLRGLPTSCPSQLNTPKQLSGTFQGYVTVPVDCLVLLPGDILKRAPSASALCGALCSGSAALAAVRAAKLDHQSVVVVSGIGGAIGHLAGMLAKKVFGAKVLGIDLAWKVARLEEIGYSEFADMLLPAAADTPGQAWADFKQSISQTCARLRISKSSERAADAVIVAASSATAFEGLEDYVCDGGQIVCSGVPYGLRLSLSIHDIVERGLQVTGSLMGGHDVCLQVMEYICDGLIHPMITEVPLEDVPQYLGNLVNCTSVGKIVARILEPDWEPRHEVNGQ